MAWSPRWCIPIWAVRPCGRSRPTAPVGCGAARRSICQGLPLRIPVGNQLVGRVIDLRGRPLDGGEELSWDESLPLYRSPPPPSVCRGLGDVYPTGIKVIDLFCPFTHGGRVAVFGGAGVGKTVVLTEFIHNAVADAGRHRGVCRDRRAIARGTRTVAGVATTRFHGSHRDGVRSDEGTTRRAVPGGPGGLVGGGIFSRRGKEGRVVSGRQRLSTRAGRHGSLRAAGTFAVACRLSADAGRRHRGDSKNASPPRNMATWSRCRRSTCRPTTIPIQPSRMPSGTWTVRSCSRAMWRPKVCIRPSIRWPLPPRRSTRRSSASATTTWPRRRVARWGDTRN